MMFRSYNRVVVSLAAVAMTTAFAASACDGYTTEYVSYDEWGYFGDWDPSLLGEPLLVGEAAIKGDFGLSELNEDTPAEVAGWHAAGFWGMDVSTIEVQAADTDGWFSMALLEVYGGLGADELEPGTRHTYHIEDDGAGVFIVATGCSGFDPGMWEYDEIAETIEVNVDPTVSQDGLRTVHFTATFARDNWTSPNYAPQVSRLSGSFQVMPMAPTRY